jgi:saccharopine dehydrogenase-like NADP-dependent oxidoreductase
VSSQKILIVGGYCVVGTRIAAQLAAEYPGCLVIGGRNPERADELAKSIGQGVRGRKIDITAPATIASALDDIAVVISCIDQPSRTLLWAAIERGLAYTDITPHLTELGRGAGFDKIENASRQHGARIVLGTGIVPGISNVIVRSLSDMLGGADEIETALVLDANDTKGPASLDYFLQELSMSYDIWLCGKDVPTRSFTTPKLVEFPPPIGAQPSYLFPFSDQVLYPRTMGVKTALTRLALLPPWLARLLAWMVRTRVSSLAATEAFRHLIVRRQNRRRASNVSRFALRVDVRRGTRSRKATLVGIGQASAAAAGAAGVARSLINGKVKPGAWMPEQILEPRQFISRLRAQGLNVEFGPDT